MQIYLFILLYNTSKHRTYLLHFRKINNSLLSCVNFNFGIYKIFFTYIIITPTSHYIFIFNNFFNNFIILFFSFNK